MTDQAEALGSDDRREWRRHPGDVARFVASLLVLGALLGVTALTPTALQRVSSDLVLLFAELAETLRDALVGIAQLSLVGVVIGGLVWLVLRRTWAEVALVVGAGVVSGVLMAGLTDWLNRAAPPEQIVELPSDWYGPDGFPSASFIAGLVAATAAAQPMMPLAWRRVARVGVALAVVVRLLTATQAPVNLAVTVALGGAVGWGVLVAFGAARRRPGAASLQADLAAGGLAVDELFDRHVSRGRRGYTGTVDGAPVRVDYLDQDDRDADLLARFVRSLRVHSLDDDVLSTRARDRVEHEALVTMLAGEAGVRVPRVRAVVPSARDAAVIAVDHLAGRSLADPDVEVSDDALADAWNQLGRLHAVRIAHRSLGPDRVLVDDDRAAVVALESARVAASDEQLAADRAALLVDTALVVGADRAVDVAVASCAATDLEEALPFVQEVALPAAARRGLRPQKALLGELRTGLQERLEVDEVELAELTRITVMGVVSWIGFAVLGAFVVGLVTGWPEIREAMNGISWPWVAPIVIATIFGTVGGALSLMGSVPRRIPLGGATIVMFGQSFLNRFTPANAGGMAMRIRYLQKGGTNPATATAAVGLTSGASGVLQVVFIAFFFLWAGSNPTEGVATEESSSPDFTVVLLFVSAVVLAVLVVAFTPSLRHRTMEIVRSTFAKVRTDLGELARSPTKMALLFGGAAITKLATIVAFVASCRAFGIDLPFSDLGARYLAASVVASAVPTPGGVGAIEAALLVVLTGAGVPEPTAWAAVLLFRLVNYWFPTVPGYIALKICERRELV